jgi:hypothetical protein
MILNNEVEGFERNRPWPDRAFAWKDGLACVTSEVRSKHPQNNNAERYRYSSLLHIDGLAFALQTVGLFSIF